MLSKFTQDKFSVVMDSERLLVGRVLAGPAAMCCTWLAVRAAWTSLPFIQLIIITSQEFGWRGGYMA